jgi:hypothetical protein
VADLRLIRERKLADLLPPPEIGGVLEASGVVVRDRDYFVVFDNVRRVARIARDLESGSTAHRWVGRLRPGEGYEDIAYSPRQRRFYLLIEAEKHPDGTYKAVIEECDEAGRYRERSWVNVVFQSRKRGFEGLSVVRRAGADYLLALCEGNEGLPGRRGRIPGGGRIVVLTKQHRVWEPVQLIKLPQHLNFKDYSAVALRGDRLAVVSQKSSRLWVGALSRADWTIGGRGRTYEFPRTATGKRCYCTVEGIDWVSSDSFVMVSDLRKRGYPDRCGRKDQSIHLFRIPTS